MDEAIFPDDRQVSITVHAYYFFSDSQGHVDLDIESYHLAFRWSWSWVFLVIRPELLQDLSLYVYQGETKTTKIVLDPLCEAVQLQTVLIDEDSCHGAANATSPVGLVNKLNTHLKSYLHDNRLLGVDEKNRGYSAYLFNRENTKDHCVIGHFESYKYFRILIATVLMSITIIITVVLPAGIVDHYSTIHETVVNKSNWLYYVWSIVLVAMIFDIVVVGFDVGIIIRGMEEKSSVSDVQCYYYICLGFVIGLPLMDVAITILAAILCSVASEIKTHPIPFFITYLNKKDSNLIFVMHCTGIAGVVLAAQLIAFHSYFIILALIASPVHSVVFLIMYGLILLCLAVLIKLIVEALHAKSKAMGCIAIPTGLAVVSIIIFVVVFRAIILLVGEYRNNDGILSIIAPIALAIFSSVLGFLAKFAVKCFKRKEKDFANLMTDKNSAMAARRYTHYRETTV